MPVPTKHLHWKTTVSQPPSITLRLGDSRQVLAEYPDEHFDSVVCDPPYELAFMGREWDKQGIAFEVSFWTEVLRVLKPGGHLLAFGGTRTYHRMVCAIEDAGFEVRDSIHWLYGTGFPKSLDVSKAIDKAAGQIGKSVVALKRELARHFNASGKTRKQVDDECGFRASNYLTLPATGKRPDPWVHVLPTEEKWTRMKEVLGCAGDQVLDEAFRAAVREVVGQQTKARSVTGKSALPTLGADVKYETWDVTAPATEEAKKWAGWGTALKPAHEPIVLARKPLSEKAVAANVLKHGTGAINVDACRVPTDETIKIGVNRSIRGGNYAGEGHGRGTTEEYENTAGRFPANVLHDGSDEVHEAFVAFGEKASGVKEGGKYERDKGVHDGGQRRDGTACYADTGSAARFFYCAKASKGDRGTGNTHPTVKPLALMRWLVRLVTPPGGTVLDPFLGSGTTALACREEGFGCVGIEACPEYLTIAEGRVRPFQAA